MYIHFVLHTLYYMYFVLILCVTSYVGITRVSHCCFLFDIVLPFHETGVKSSECFTQLLSYKIATQLLIIFFLNPSDKSQ